MRPLLLLLALAVSACANSSDSPGDDYPADMRNEHDHDAPVASGAVADVDTTTTTGRWVTYSTLEGRPVRGYLARPVGDTTAALPGLVVIQEWWGLNDNVRLMARRLAAEGYVALAVDLYDGHVATTPDSAQAYMQTALGRQEALMGTVGDAITYLKTTAHATRIGTIGWCFGGGWSLETALAYPEGVDAAVMYYGQVVTNPAQLASLQAPLLGLFGGADDSIPEADIRQMETALREQNKTVDIHIYPDAAHAFANPSGERYNAQAAEDAWGRATAFLGRELMGNE